MKVPADDEIANFHLWEYCMFWIDNKAMEVESIKDEECQESVMERTH